MSPLTLFHLLRRMPCNSYLKCKEVVHKIFNGIFKVKRAITPSKKYCFEMQFFIR
jgi:hypothetical protein